MDVQCSGFISVLKTHNTEKKTEKKRFLSLKWKMFFIISLIITAVNAIYFSYLYNNLNSRFESERSNDRLSIIAMLNSSSEQTFKKLISVGNLIPSINRIDKYFELGEWNKVNQLILDFWPTIQTEYDVDGIIFFNHLSQPVFYPSSVNTIKLNSERLTQAVRRVNSNFNPVSLIECNMVCSQIAVIPYLSKQGNVSVIVIYSSIADVVVSFSKLASLELGILTRKEATDNQMFNLSNWQLNIAALTKMDVMKEVLTAFSEQTEYSKTLQERNIFAWKEKYYDIYTTSIDQGVSSDANSFVILDEVTREISEIDAIIEDSLLLSLLGLIISEMAILFVLWRPLSRLRITSEILPLLAEGQYETARKVIDEKSKLGSYTKDEIDLVSESSTRLSHQLESLNNDVEKYTKTLAENMQQLTREKDFTLFLVDTAQVIILTLDENGTVQHINKYGQQLIGYPLSEMVGQNITRYINNTKELEEFKRGFDDVCHQNVPEFTIETSILTHSGKHKTIAWVHSFIVSEEKRPAIVLSVGSDITERKASEKRMSWLANHDPLTGLYNRRYFNEVFNNYLQYVMRYKNSGALLFLDLDNFKYVNDTQGHQTGDKLIKDVSLALRRITRNADIISRIGGDEFAIVIPDIDETGVIEFCNALNRRINAVIKPITNAQQNVAISIGVAMFPKHGQTVSELLANADIAMYQAKERGGGSWHLFAEHENVRERIQHHVNWKDRIESALNNNGFSLFYQPIMDITERRITHYEVLLRMKDGKGGFFLPSPFVEVAENTGLIQEIDRMVVSKTIDILSQQTSGKDNFRFSVNLSARTFSDRANLPLLKTLLQNAEKVCNKIIFEITETAALQDIGAACDLIDALQKMGCRFAIDDFGVGFSSFYYLRELPVDYVKIDGSFIQQLSSNRDDQLIVRAMTEIVRGFGKKTIAEYVEDESTLELLRQYGVDYAQGYFVGIPAESTKIERQFKGADLLNEKFSLLT